MLFRRLHYKLTGLCALITILVLAVFAGLYLHVAEETLRENHALAFQHDFDTICSSLEQQSTITYQYLLRMEQNHGYLFFLWDNGTPLLFNSLSSHGEYLPLACQLYSDYQNRELGEQKSPSVILEPELLKPNTGSVPLLAGIAPIYPGQLSATQGLLARKRTEGLVLVLLAPQDTFRRQLSSQRFLFLLLSLAGCIIFILFAWLFTGRLIKPLEESQKRQLQFVAGASHELRTPLAVIASSASLRPPGFEDAILQESLRMSRLVEDMLVLTGLEGGKQGITPAPLEPDTFLLNFYEEVQGYVHSKNHTLRLSLPEDSLPSISGDGDKLKQLLLILLDNAISYSPAAEPITLALAHTGKYVCFQVVDKGGGIPPEEKEKIFGRFYRGDSAHHSKEHFGLGLSIAWEIMALHRGKLTVTDTPGGGSTFSCYFPL